MKCIICDSAMESFFTKRFNAFGIGNGEYWRCPACTLVLSKTHQEMSLATWEKVNHDWHVSYQGSESNPGDPRWRSRLRSQAKVLRDALDIGLLDGHGPWLDFGCGDGKLTNLMRTDYGVELLKYERYVPQASDYLEDNQLISGGFSCVI